MKKYLSIGIGAVLLLGGALLVVNVNKTQAASGNLTGWAWSSNIGWISVNSSNSAGTDCGAYCVAVDASGNMTGYAWSSNIGWIKFGGLSAMPNGGANALLNFGNGTVTGFARACAGTVQSGGPPLAYIQSISQDRSANVTTLTFPSANTAGNLIVVGLRVGILGRTATISDSQGNVYRKATDQQTAPDDEDFIFYAPNIKAGANTVTAAISGTATRMSWAIHEYSGADTLDQVSSATGSGATTNPGAKTTTSANELIFGFSSVIGTSAFTPAALYTKRQTQVSKFASEDRIVSSTGSYDATFTLGTSGAWSASMATFKYGDCSSMTSRTDGWDGWIQLTGTNHTTTYSGGDLGGYAWGADVVGWVSMTGVHCPSCTVAPPITGSCSMTYNGVTGSPVNLPYSGGNITFSASGASGGTAPYTYAWQTGVASGAGATYVGSYPAAGSSALQFFPSLLITDSTSPTPKQSGTIYCGAVNQAAAANQNAGSMDFFIGKTVDLANTNRASGLSIAQGNPFALTWVKPAGYNCTASISNLGDPSWASKWNTGIVGSASSAAGLTTAGVPLGVYIFTMACTDTAVPPGAPINKSTSLEVKSSSVDEI